MSWDKLAQMKGKKEELQEKKSEEKPKAKKQKKEPKDTPKQEESKPTKKRKDIHQLSEKNLLLAIQVKKKTKLNELFWYFLQYNPKYTQLDIQNLIEKCLKEKKLKRDRNGWISLKIKRE